jgi:hypothetical protein
MSVEGRNSPFDVVHRCRRGGAAVARTKGGKLEGDRVVHHVDGSWNPNWHGDLSRPFKLAGDRLVISGAHGIDPRTGEEVVHRMEFNKV